MPKVVFINRYFYPDHSATSQLLYDLALHLARRGVDVHVLTSRQLYNDPAAELPRAERYQGIVIHRIDTSTLGRARLFGRALDYLTFYANALRMLVRLVASRDCVVAKTDPPLISVCAALVCRWKGAFLVNWVQDLFPEVAVELGVGGGRMGVGLLRGLRNWSLRAATHNVVLGFRMCQRLRGEGVPIERIGIIHNWADGSAIRPVDPCDNLLRRAWGLADWFVVGYSGNMGRAHEFETLLEAAEALRDEPRIAFLLIGDGAQRQRLEAEARRRGLKRMIFQPYQPREHLALSLGASDVHVVSLQPSLEGLIVPSKFYGIAAAGRPTLFIGEAAGEIGALIKAHTCGTTVRAGDVSELVKRIRDLAAHPETAQQWGCNARRAFAAYFDKPLALAAWERLLLSLLSSESPAPAETSRARARPPLAKSG